MQWLRCVCHPPTWNIGGHLGRLHNLWINIGDCGQRKEAQGRVRPSSRWLGSVLFTKAPYLLDKPLTKASPFFFGSVSLPALQPFTLQKDSADVQSGVHIQQAHGMCPLYIWCYAKCWAYRRGQNRYLPSFPESTIPVDKRRLRNLLVMKKSNDLNVFGPPQELATHSYICMWL